MQEYNHIVMSKKKEYNHIEISVQEVLKSSNNKKHRIPPTEKQK